MGHVDPANLGGPDLPAERLTAPRNRDAALPYRNARPESREWLADPSKTASSYRKAYSNCGRHLTAANVDQEANGSAAGSQAQNWPRWTVVAPVRKHQPYNDD